MAINIGDKVGTLKMLTVVGAAPPSPKGSARWFCKCDCGTIKSIQASNLAIIASCGCYRKQFMRTHGQYRTAEYKAWTHMRERCMNPANKHFASYGGRGITVCERWNQYENFIADAGPRPSSRHSLDRIDNDQGYSPENCQWTTRSVQMQNTRRTRMLTFNGETMALTAWARKLGLNPTTIQSRIDVYGWTVEQALTLVPQKGKKPNVSLP